MQSEKTSAFLALSTDKSLSKPETTCPFFTTGLVIPSDKASLITAQDESLLKNYERVELPDTGSSLLGKGAFGQVFLMRHKQSAKLVAMKVVHKGAARKPAALKALAQEIEIHKRLIHENIVRLYEFFEGPKNIYIVMEYASKGTLFHYIRKKKKLDEKEAFRLFMQVCNAIHFLHVHKLMHRDIKPENLLFTDSATLKLGDFGCCTDFEGERKTFCGTAEYIAPEIIRGQTYGEKADIWSLGVLLYEMFHGHSPYAGKAERDVFDKVLDSRITFASDLPADARTLIQSMLSKDPLARPSAEQILSSTWTCRMQSAAILPEGPMSPIHKHEEYKASSAHLSSNSTVSTSLRPKTDHGEAESLNRTKGDLLQDLPRGLVYGYPEYAPSPISDAKRKAKVKLVKRPTASPKSKSSSLWSAAFSFVNSGDDLQYSAYN